MAGPIFPPRGGPPDPARDPRRRLLRNPTAGYHPASGWHYWGVASASLDGKPWFTWLDVPRMLRDPRVRFLERCWRSPFQRVKFKVAGDDRVKKYVARTLRRFWVQSFPQMLARYFRWGFAPGGAEFVPHRGAVTLDRVRTVEPPEARPLQWADGALAGRPAGFTAGDLKVLVPHAVWFAGYAEISPWYDVPPIAGVFEPWLEKRGRNGAIDSRRTWYRKNASRGGTVRHPPGTSNYGTDENPQVRDNQDVAREIIDYAETNSYFTLENTHHPSIEGKYAWELEPPESFPDRAGFLEYPQQLDKEMSEGCGIPNEVFEAADVGSGWSGRMIPLMAWLGGVDELVGLGVKAFDPTLRYAVAANFGRDAYYEVEPQSLVEQVQEQAGAGKGGGEGENPVPGLLGAQKKPGGGWEPYTRRDGSNGLKNSQTHQYRAMSGSGYVPAKVRRKVKRLLAARDLADGRGDDDLYAVLAAAMLRVQARATRAGHPESAVPALRRLAELAADPNRLAAAAGVRGLSWVPYLGKRGKSKGKQVGWFNTDTQTVRYQKAMPGRGRPGKDAVKPDRARAKELLGRLAGGEAEPQHYADLASHLPALTVAELREARRQLGASFGGAAQKQGMVDMLVQFARSKAPAPEPAKKPEPARRPAARPKPREEPKPAPAAPASPLPAPHAPAGKPLAETLAGLAPGHLGATADLRAAAGHLTDEQFRDELLRLADAGTVRLHFDSGHSESTPAWMPASPASAHRPVGVAANAFSVPERAAAAPPARTHSGPEIAAAYNAGPPPTPAEANALIRAAAALPKAEAAEAVRAIGLRPIGDPRRQLGEAVHKRAGATTRRNLMNRGAAADAARAALGDEDLVSLDAVFGPKPQRPRKPARATSPPPAARPPRPPADPPATDEGRDLAGLFDRAASATPAEVEAAAARLAALPKAELHRVAAAMGYRVRAGESAAKTAAALHAAIAQRHGRAVRNTLLDRPADPA